MKLINIKCRTIEELIPTITHNWYYVYQFKVQSDNGKRVTKRPVRYVVHLDDDEIYDWHTDENGVYDGTKITKAERRRIADEIFGCTMLAYTDKDFSADNKKPLDDLIDAANETINRFNEHKHPFAKFVA